MVPRRDRGGDRCEVHQPQGDAASRAPSIDHVAQFWRALMNAPECPREQLVVNAVLAGTWPHGSDDSLVAHAETCEVCREVAAVSVLLRDDLDASRIEAHVPAAGQVWWRAAVRARLESTQAATRPMTWMHAITAATVAGVFLAAITAMWPRVPALINMLRSVSSDLWP